MSTTIEELHAELERVSGHKWSEPKENRCPGLTAMCVALKSGPSILAFVGCNNASGRHWVDLRYKAADGESVELSGDGATLFDAWSKVASAIAAADEGESDVA